MPRPQALCGSWNTHSHTHSNMAQCALSDAHRHIITCRQMHGYIQAHSYTLVYHLHLVTSQTHTQAHTVYPHHPWVMNNICLSVPPSLPLAWLLACSWLLCHNVILSASLSPITKMCSDNQGFFFLLLHRPLHLHHLGPVVLVRTVA